MKNYPKNWEGDSGRMLWEETSYILPHHPYFVAHIDHVDHPHHVDHVDHPHRVDHIGELEQVAVACDSIGKLFPGCFCPRHHPNSYTPKQASFIFIQPRYKGYKGIRRPPNSYTPPAQALFLSK